MLTAVKVIAVGLKGGSSCLEGYTYHFMPAGNIVLGAYMLEICESTVEDKSVPDVLPL